MPDIVFLPQNLTVTVEPGTKILRAAIKSRINIRYGCASCRCGTCGIAVKVEGSVSPMAEDEKLLLEQMHLVTDGSVRLACQTKVLDGKVTVDLDFQFTY